MSGSLLLLGFVIGMRHAVEADHVAAVSSLATRAGSVEETIRPPGDLRKYGQHEDFAWYAACATRERNMAVRRQMDHLATGAAECVAAIAEDIQAIVS